MPFCRQNSGQAIAEVPVIAGTSAVLRVKWNTLREKILTVHMVRVPQGQKLNSANLQLNMFTNEEL